MITDLFMTIIMVAFILVGFSKPHMALCSAVWVNIVQPQSTSFSFLQGQQLSLFFTLYFFLIFVIHFKKVRVPRSFAYHFLMLGFMVWITIATYLAQFQSVAWIKYDVAIKTLIFSYFIPFALTNKKQVETFIWVSASAFLYFIFIAGFKSLLGGGGYGVTLIGLGGFLYTEGSTLSTLSICLIPIVIYLRSNTSLTDNRPMLRHFLSFMILLCLAVLVGTQARTGLVALAVFVIINFFQTNKKFKYILASMVFLASFLMIATDEWYERMNTLNVDNVQTTEVSSIGRLVVWRWTFDYVRERPFFGGGFYAHNANAGLLHLYQRGNEKSITAKGGKAFHNIFFEVLGETGYGGLLFFCGIIFHFFLLVKIKDSKGKNEFIECKKALRASFIIYCCGGLFIGVAFYPWMYYLYCCGVAVSQIENNMKN